MQTEPENVSVTVCRVVGQKHGITNSTVTPLETGYERIVCLLYGRLLAVLVEALSNVLTVR